MEADPKYSKEDIERMWCYPDGKNHKRHAERANFQPIKWKTNEYLPEGWMCSSSNGGNICVKADDNTKLKSYKAAVAYMEADPKYTKEDVKRMYCYPDGKDHKKLSVSANLRGGPKEEMQGSQYLPDGWLFRNKKKGLDILTADGTKLESYISIQRYMEYKGDFTKDQMDLVWLFPDGVKHKKGQK